MFFCLVVRTFEVKFDMGRWNGTLLPKLARLYGSTICQKVSSWFLARVVRDVEATPIWISFAQLYLDFQLTWGHPGPLRVQGQWIDTDSRPYIEPESFTFKQRVKWFRQMIKWMFKEAGIVASWAQCRPQSGIIQTFLPSVSLPWTIHSLQEVERWLELKLSSPCARDAGVLCSLPLAERNTRLQVD